MTKLALALLALGSLGGSALAQDYGNGSSRRNYSNNGYQGGAGYGTSTGSWGVLPGTGYSPGYNPGWGYGGGCRPGFGYPGFGTIWGGSGSYFGYGGYTGGYYGYEGDGYLGVPNASATVTGPAPQPALPRSPLAVSSREIEEGRRRFRNADYRGAVDSFRSAVVAATEYPVAQAWFAVSLIAAGDGRNADKAIRSAAASGLLPGALSLDGLFRDDKERVRLIVALAKVGNEGGLAAAYALSLAGEPVRLKQLAEKDAAAKLLLPKP